MSRPKLRAVGIALTSLCLLSNAMGFGGEVILSSNWRDWHHNVLTRAAAQQAGFIRAPKLLEMAKEDDIDSAAAEIGWHASFLDSYAYNPLFWVTRGPHGYTTAMALHNELIKLHYDDLNSTPQLRHTIFQYTTGTLTGLLWAKSVYDGGERTKGIAIARHILGISLHATQDMYSHSNWIDASTRRQSTWFGDFTTNPSGTVSTQFYTGAYEHPEQLSVHSHGVMSPSMSALQAIAPIMDLFSGSASPVHDMPIFETWRKYKGRSEAIMPGTIDGTLFGLEQTAQQDISGGLGQITDAPSQQYIGLPPNLLYVAPPGMAIDASYLAKIAVRERNLIDITPSNAFLTAYRCAYDASQQWLKRLDEVFKNNFSSGSDFWTQVKTAPATGLHHTNFEDFTSHGFSFISAGNYPVDSPLAQSQLAADPNKLPPTEYFLRLNIDTSTIGLAGTDADIYAEAGGKRFLLDQGPVQNKGMADAFFAFNDFEGGTKAVYTIGPFTSLPTTVKLKNEAGDLGQVLLNIGQGFVDAISNIFIAIGDFFQLITGAKPDYVGEKRKVWTAQQLVGINATGYEESLRVDGGEEGIYDLKVKIAKISSTADTDTFRISPTRLVCIKESTIDQLDGRWGDEIFVVSAVTPFPGNTIGNRTGLIKEVKTGTTKGITGQDYEVTVPKRYGGIAYAAMIMESDSEDSPARDVILNKYMGKMEVPAAQRNSLLSEVGRMVAPDWHIGRMEVTAFSRGATMGLGKVYGSVVNAWLPANKEMTFTLNPGAFLTMYRDPLHLQKLDTAQGDPNNPIKVKNPITLPPGTLPGGTIKPPVTPPVTPPTTPPVTPPTSGAARPLGKILVVDDDRSQNNDNASQNALILSKCDQVFAKLLADADLKFDTIVVGSYASGPDYDQMSKYDTVFWYMGDQVASGTLSGDDQNNLRAWVSEPNRTLFLSGPGFIGHLQGYVSIAKSHEEKWFKSESTFLMKTMGLKGAVQDVLQFTDADVTDIATGDVYMVGKDSSVTTRISVLNPGATAKGLVTFPANPDGKGVRPVPIATVNRMGTSSCIFLAFPLENITVKRQKLFMQILNAR